MAKTKLDHSSFSRLLLNQQIYIPPELINSSVTKIKSNVRQAHNCQYQFSILCSCYVIFNLHWKCLTWRRESLKQYWNLIFLLLSFLRILQCSKFLNVDLTMRDSGVVFIGNLVWSLVAELMMGRIRIYCYYSRERWMPWPTWKNQLSEMPGTKY